MVPAELPSVIGSVVYGGKRTRLAVAFSNHRRLDHLKKLVESGDVAPVIDSAYTLDQIEQAHERAEQHGMFGKVVVRIAPDARPRKGAPRA